MLTAFRVSLREGLSDSVFLLYTHLNKSLDESIKLWMCGRMLMCLLNHLWHSERTVTSCHVNIILVHLNAKHKHTHTQTISFTCSKDPLQAIRRPGSRSACLSWGSGVGCGGWWVRLWREIWRRIASLYQHLSCTKQTHTVLAGQDDGLLHHLITHWAKQLLFHALHVGLERRTKEAED